MSKTTVQLSFEEYLIYDDGTAKRYELEDGVLLEMPPASDQHEAIIAFLLIQFYLEIQRLKLDWQVRPSGTGVRTSGKKSRLPDVVVMTPQQRQSIFGKSAVLQSPPLLVVEVASPGSEEQDYQKKPIEYAAIGVPEYWIVDSSANKVTVMLLTNDEYCATEFIGREQISSRTFPEMTLTVEQVISV